MMMMALQPKTSWEEGGGRWRRGRQYFFRITPPGQSTITCSGVYYRVRRYEVMFLLNWAVALFYLLCFI